MIENQHTDYNQWKSNKNNTIILNFTYDYSIEHNSHAISEETNMQNEMNSIKEKETSNKALNWGGKHGTE